MPIRLRWGDPLPAIPGNIEVHALRLLRVVRLRVRGEVEHAGERDPPWRRRLAAARFVPDSYARRISTNKRGRVDGVIYFDATRREHFQRAKAVIVCAN
ncbi:MAG TPA: hypothetical protein VE734_06380 [Terriglobales bacterium]|nr:hypothetical protein [Terriglobales bacterium]